MYSLKILKCDFKYLKLTELVGINYTLSLKHTYGRIKKISKDIIK